MAGRKPLYQSPDEVPVSTSLRIPRALYDEAQQYVSQHRMTMTEFVLDAIRLRLDTPADPRDIILSDNSNTVMQHIQELVNAAVQAALASGYGPPMPAPATEVAAVPSDDIRPASDNIQHYDNNTVIQEKPVAVQENGTDMAPAAAGTRRGVPKLTPRQVAALRRKRQRGTPIKALMEEYGISKATVFRYLQ
jgi:hypothetical protein